MKGPLPEFQKPVHRTQPRSLIHRKLGIACHVGRPPWISRDDYRVCPWQWSAELLSDLFKEKEELGIIEFIGEINNFLHGFVCVISPTKN